MAFMKKPADPVVALESKQTEHRRERERAQAQLTSWQQELASLLAAQQGIVLSRAPLSQAVQTAQTLAHEAGEALGRNIGKPSEDIYSAKAYEAEVAHKQAQDALTAFEKECGLSAKVERIATLRTALSEGEASLRKIEAALLSLSAEIDQAVEGAQRAALKRIFLTMADMLAVIEADGPVLARMRNDPVAFERMMDELSISREQLFDLISASTFESGGYHVPVSYTGARPYLRERQQQIRERLSKLQG